MTKPMLLLPLWFILKYLYESRVEDVFLRLPSAVLGTPPLPLDEVLQLSVPHSLLVDSLGGEHHLAEVFLLHFLHLLLVQGEHLNSVS